MVTNLHSYNLKCWAIPSLIFHGPVLKRIHTGEIHIWLISIQASVIMLKETKMHVYRCHKPILGSIAHSWGEGGRGTQTTVYSPFKDLASF